ncbi:MAG TPA: hypothetical protein VGM90_27245 [Kofleriaceae bacterium]|jgi:hypothetical protein
MSRSALLALAVPAAFLVGCGDNKDGASDAGADGNGVCAPTPPEKPSSGVLADPEAIDLGADCVAGGLRTLPGRWWLREKEFTVKNQFDFEYPRFEGDCTQGFRRANWKDEDTDLADGVTYQTWSDGTRFYTRLYNRFDSPQGTFEYADVLDVCMTADGSLAGVHIISQTGRDDQIVTEKGTPFSPHEPEVAKGLSLVGELNTAGIKKQVAYDIAVDGNYAYMASPDGLQIIDITDPTHPTHVHQIPGDLNDITLYRNGAQLIGYGAPFDGQTTQILDLSDPHSAFQVNTIFSYSHTIEITPNTTPPKMYFGNYTDHVPIYDITTPTTPTLIASVPIPGGDVNGIHDTFISGSRIYANKTNDGVYAVDVSSGTATPTLLGHVATEYSHNTYEGVVNGKRIAIHGDEGMTPMGGAYMRIIDAEETSPTFMQVIGTFQTRHEVGIHNMVIKDNKAYVAYYQDGVRIIDLTDPTHPTEVGHYNTFDNDTAPGEGFEGALGLAIVGDLIYVADDLRDLVILRIDPT